MSGRSAPNRGKKGHKQRGFDSDNRQLSSSSSNHSGKYNSSREQPPRFLNRPRNGDGRSNSSGSSRDDYSGGGGRKDSGGHKGSGSRLQQGATGSLSGGGRSSNLGEFGSRWVSVHCVWYGAVACNAAARFLCGWSLGIVGVALSSPLC